MAKFPQEEAVTGGPDHLGTWELKIVSRFENGARATQLEAVMDFEILDTQHRMIRRKIGRNAIPLLLPAERQAIKQALDAAQARWDAELKQPDS
jgi:hypothetical protein